MKLLIMQFSPANNPSKSEALCNV